MFDSSWPLSWYSSWNPSTWLFPGWETAIFIQFFILLVEVGDCHDMITVLSFFCGRCSRTYSYTDLFICTYIYIYIYVCMYIYTQYITVDYRNLRLWSVLVCVCVCVCMQMCALVVCYSCGATPSIQKRSRIHNLKYRGGLAALVPDFGVWAASFVCPTGPTPHSLFVQQACSPGHAVCSRETFSVPMPASVRWFKLQNIYVETTRSLPSFASDTWFFSDYHGSLLNFLDTLCAFLCEILDGESSAWESPSSPVGHQYIPDFKLWDYPILKLSEAFAIPSTTSS